MDEKSIDRLLAALEQQSVSQRAAAAHKAAARDAEYAATGMRILWVGLRAVDGTILVTPDKATALDYAGGDARLARRWYVFVHEDSSVRLLCKVRDVVTARLGVPTPLPAFDPEPRASEDA